MAITKFVAALLLALIGLSLLQTMVMASHGHGGHHFDNTNIFGPESLQSYQCPTECTRRCGGAQSFKPVNICMSSCMACCQKCLCVPPGYYGNKAVCPCYFYTAGCP